MLRRLPLAQQRDTRRDNYEWWKLSRRSLPSVITSNKEVIVMNLMAKTGNFSAQTAFWYTLFNGSFVV